MRLALLSPCFWPEVRRGTERFVRELADGLIAAGERPELITSAPGRGSGRTEDGLPVLRLPRPPQGLALRRGYEPYLTHVPLSYAALRLRPGGYELAHAVYPADAIAAARWRRRTGRPAVLSYMGIPDRVGLMERRLRLQTLRAGISGVDAVVALSRYAADAFAYWLGCEARVIAPGVDLDVFVPASGPAAQDGPPTIVCAAAAGEPRKGVRVLAQAATLLRASEVPDLRLVLSAPSSTAARVAAARELAGIDPIAAGIQWRELDDRGALAAAYREASLSVLPARGEAFGLVIAESLACGTPVVGLRDGAIPEVLDGDERIGRLVDEAEPRALAQTILGALPLASSPDTRAACRARAERFGTAACTDAYRALYAELLAQR